MSRSPESKAKPWEPIKDLPDNWQELASPELASLAAVWRERYEVLKDTPGLKEFNDRLAREWAIETGIIENLYTLDRGTTQTLIEHGIRADYIAHGASNKDAEYVTALIEDQRDALEKAFEFVKGNRKLTTSYIKELHVGLTRHQKTLTVKDQFGNLFETPLSHGEWKQQPNNPYRSDGSLAIEYAPPIHTASEIDRLIEMHTAHASLNLPPEIEAAWLHHRFTQIHPFQDGNGRIARTLASIVFIKAGLFPTLITSEIRAEYIQALEEADTGYEKPLIDLFTNRQAQSMLMALDSTRSHLEG